MNKIKLHIAIPLMDEQDNISSLLDSIRAQTYTNFKVWMVINQPENYWHYPDKIAICQHNELSLKRLAQVDDFPLSVIDHASKGHGWTGKNTGVGMARKVLMETIASQAAIEDLIVSLDADTHFKANYFQSIADNFAAHPDIPALSIPYFHPLTGNNNLDRAILYYEIYMRHYRLNMSRIHSPYNFTALGSALACTLQTYRIIGGMTPKKSGEDFYFLQKITKFKPLRLWNEEKVFPAARFSDRVFFGTGPAMIKGAAGDWSSYPIYPQELFDEIEKFFLQFPNLYSSDLPNIGNSIFGKGWTKNIRNNATTTKAFMRACHHKFDGLRTLQFLKINQKKYPMSNEDNFKKYVARYHPDRFPNELLSHLSFAESSIEALSKIREILVEIDDEDLSKA